MLIIVHAEVTRTIYNNKLDYFIITKYTYTRARPFRCQRPTIVYH